MANQARNERWEQRGRKPPLSTQLGLMGREAPSLDGAFRDMERIDLGQGAWLDHQPGWVSGHQTLFDTLASELAWSTDCRKMYERMVEVPRLYASIPTDSSDHPVIDRMRRLLISRYRLCPDAFGTVHLALYRDGRDSVAWHADKDLRDRDTSFIALVSLGEPRRFALRPRGGGPSPYRFRLGWGDLTVMGGTCQRFFEHAVPKQSLAGPRMSLQFRATPPEPVPTESAG